MEMVKGTVEGMVERPIVGVKDDNGCEGVDA
jgi:hypothetical protein